MPVRTVDEMILSRKTSKVLSRTPLSGELSPPDLDGMIRAAAQAPFHYAASAEHRSRLEDGAPEPWRFHVLNRRSCLELREWLMANNDTSKIPDMLAAASVLIQVTWCPNPPPSGLKLPPDSRFHASEINMEHIAATAAAIQNLLLHATRHSLPSYWSSGGPLGNRPVFNLLGIPIDEILLGAVFLFPADTEQTEQIQIMPGKMREKRSKNRSWCKILESLKN